MQLSIVFIFTIVVLCATAAPAPERRQTNLNQGSDRLVSQGADGTFQVDGIKFDNADVACQVACALDEKDCITAGGSSSDCKQKKIDCQSGNALNGESAPLNNESP